MIRPVGQIGRGALTALALAAAAIASASAETYPARTVQIVNPYAAGSTTDILARALAIGLSRDLGQSFVVLNRDGAAGAIGTGVVAAAKPDGYTIIFVPALVLTVLPHTRRDLGYASDALEPICHTFENVMAIAVRPDSPFKTARDMIEAARREPSKLNWGHGGVASIPYLATVELLQTAGVKVTDVPYRGDPLVFPDLTAGRIDFVAVVAGVLTGREVRVLGIFADERHPSFPDVPTFREQGYPVAQTSFGGLFAPKGTPMEIAAILERACKAAAESDEYRLAAQRANQPPRYWRSREQFRERIAADDRIKSKIVRELGIQPQ